MDRKIAKRIKEIRTDRSYTQLEFANLLGLGRSTITNIENGFQNPSRRVIRDIGIICGINPEWITDGKQPKLLEGSSDRAYDLPGYRIIDLLEKEYNFNEIEKNLVLRYCELPKNERRAIAKYLTSLSDTLYFFPDKKIL